MNLKSRYNELTTAVQDRLQRAVDDGSLGAQKLFLTLPESYPSFPLVAVLNRRLSEVESSFSHHYAEVEMQFGATTSSLRPSEKDAELVDICLNIAELFLSDVRLGGAADYTRITGLESDPAIELPDSTRRWATVSLAWRFQFNSGGAQ